MSSQKQPIRLLAMSPLLVAMVFLSACGGGGGGDPGGNVDNDNGSGNGQVETSSAWDEMEWDEGQWQ
ncbi:hypothetical protein [Marinimicrobium sp. ABcell2]|uniref:hypothetical protein n=1 Tax=Marinimicrobium sp. ABcell2 TaxID=3069751 RepID=UPI0027B7947B|nr:hypothetical protein [Marinimicrobium sp. ABcell2]MDQ2077795.1 hypothetical protein [Marinimicrobium sp. ABcell2]